VSFSGFDEPGVTAWLEHLINSRYRAKGQRPSTGRTWFRTTVPGRPNGQRVGGERASERSERPGRSEGASPLQAQAERPQSPGL